MSDYSSFTHKWRAVPTSTVEPNKVSKRNRQPVSCQPCRARKLKCDRGHPCEACTKRNDEDVCHYGKSSVSSSAAQHHSSQSRLPSTGRAQDRLRQLEDLVRQMIEPPKSDDHDSTSQQNPSEDSSTKEGPLNRDRHGLHYTGSTHWSAILDQIQDLRTMISVDIPPSAHRTSPDSPFEPVLNDGANPALSGTNRERSLFSAHQPLSLPQLLDKYLPPRQNVDRLLSIFFNERYTPFAFIHTKVFNRQYEEFWKDTISSKVSPMWLSILFSILAMGNMIRLAINADFETGMETRLGNSLPNGSTAASDSQSPESDQIMSDAGSAKGNSWAVLGSLDYLAASAQFLVLGDYTRPQPLLVEALCIHTQARYGSSLDPGREVMLVQSILVRQAYSMSYHRDCTNFAPGQYSVFEAEIRRRCWAAICQLDLMICFQYGIPMNIAEASWDTQVPRHLLDTDFDEDSEFLPESRGDSEPTQMLYFVYKTHLMTVYGKILRHSLSFPQTVEAMKAEDTKATVMNLDAEVRKAAETIPAVMKVRPMNLSFSDPSWLIMLRTNLMFLVQKSLCVLHRKYMLPDARRANDDSTYSRKVVVDASSKIVKHFLEIHAEFQPGGQLSRDWWMLGSFAVNDFLLAVMLLCFAFWMERKKNVRRSGNESRVDVLKWLQRDEEARSIFEALGKAKCVCEIYGKSNSESKRVAEVLWVVLDKFASTNDNLSPRDNQHDNNQSQKSPNHSSSVPTSQSDAEERDRLDMTPLSINEHSTSVSSSSNQFTTPRSTSQTSLSPPGHEATWTMVEAVPYKKKSIHRPKGSIPSNGATQTHQPSTVHTISPQTDPLNLSRGTQSFSQPSIDSSTIVPATTTDTTLLEDDPFASFFDVNNESIDMDWASFDQILGNFGAGTPMDYTNQFSSNGSPFPMSVPAFGYTDPATVVTNGSSGGNIAATSMMVDPSGMSGNGLQHNGHAPGLAWQDGSKNVSPPQLPLENGYSNGGVLNQWNGTSG